MDIFLSSTACGGAALIIGKSLLEGVAHFDVSVNRWGNGWRATFI